MSIKSEVDKIVKEKAEAEQKCIDEAAAIQAYKDSRKKHIFESAIPILETLVKEDGRFSIEVVDKTQRNHLYSDAIELFFEGRKLVYFTADVGFRNENWDDCDRTVEYYGIKFHTMEICDFRDIVVEIEDFEKTMARYLLKHVGLGVLNG